MSTATKGKRPRLTEAEKALRDYYRSQTEKQWQATVLAWAAQEGWHTAHFHDSRREVTRKDGTKFFVGDKAAKGWPDTVLAKGSVLMVAELKKEDGTTTPEQRNWMDWLVAAGIPTFLWKPHDRAEVQAILSGEPEPVGGWPTAWTNVQKRTTP